MSGWSAFCDAQGVLVSVCGDDVPAVGAWAGAALGVDEHALNALFRRTPHGVWHVVSIADHQSQEVRVLPLPASLAPQGGYVLEVRRVTRAFSVTAAGQHIEVPPGLPAPGLDCAVFNAVFQDAREAIVLADASFSILAANRKAHSLYATEGATLAGASCRIFVRVADQARFWATVRTLKSGAAWRTRLITQGADGQTVPVKLTARSLVVDGARLYQFMMRDLRGRMALERDLATSRTEVENMNIALKQVLRNVEEERQELKDELVQQVREEVLPTVERIVQEDSPLVRQAFKSALEERIADMHDGPPNINEQLSALTPRERDICRLIQQGWQGRAIADELNIAFETLQSHRKNIRRKLGARGRSQPLAVVLQQYPPL